ncbi:armadillo repeat-containing protein 3, partial [Polyergus mexicanus]|uniref:armadillo repeat-containing protein 3 n=1 Tax=Polyergus mexicanus TaxID=615972 RepID=UPI0038B5BDA8
YKNEERGEQEKDEKEAELKYIPFRSSLSETKDVESTILLLQSKEKATLLAVIETLSKYANKSKDNVKILFDLGIVNNILPIIEHKDLFIRRFAAKLLVEMMAMPDVTIYLIESNYLLHFAKLLTSEEDIFMQEYFSTILARLSRNSYATALLANHCLNMNFLFDGIQSSDPDVKKNSIEILYNLIQDPVAARTILKTEKFNFPLLYQHFESSYPEIQCLALNAVLGIIERNKDEDIQSLFYETNGVGVLLNFLKNEWNNLHIKALRILHFAAENSIIADKLIEIGSIPQILSYIEHIATPKLFVEALKVIVHIANTSNGRKVLHSYEIIDHLIDALQRWMQPDIAEVVCYGIGKMALFTPAAKEFANLLKKEDLQWSAKHAAGYALKQLLMSDIRNCDVFLDINGQIISRDLIVANAFVENKYLSYMLNNPLSSRVIPSWDTCIEMLFKSHLPIKFALTGRLSLQDLTQDGFYVSRRNICPFPVLDDIFRFKYCPLEPIYVVNCVQSSTLSNVLQTAVKENINVLSESKFGRLQYDPYFIEYVEFFKCMILTTESKRDVNASDKLTIRYVPLRAKMLAQFVARQMSGFDSTSKCIDHQLEVHLREIKECLEMSVIPIGQLRVGSYLERALLFKVIADRICLPAALVRGEYGISWVEIAVPQIEKISSSKDYRSIVYPTKLIKPNFIVDLMDIPGDLIPIGSLRSKLYCSKKITYNKICCH